MASHTFIEKLLVRLKSGDARSIHLNALPGNFARLDIYDLINIETSLHLKFLENLLSKREFKFSITIDPTLLNEQPSAEKKVIQKIISRLNHLDYQEKEEFSEHGYHSFGFGYPILVKRDPNNKERILKAPLLIWYLDIEKDTRKNNTWTISRSEQHPLVFNELLQAHFESVERINTNDIDTFIEEKEDFINEQQLNEFCQLLLNKLNIPFPAADNIVTILPCTNKENIENITKETPWIRWSGVLGLYKMQKQSIIKDVENLKTKQTLNEINQDENTATYFDGEVLSPILLDPSQENVLQQLKENNSIIIQGPPGTGKSQSLTAIITQALLNHQKVLIVCEKRTAMEVLYNNLKEENLEHLCTMIDDVYRDRKNIVEIVRNIIENNEQRINRFRTNEYEQIHAKFLTLQEEINHRINFSNTLIFGDDNWTELLSKSYALNQNKNILEEANSLNKNVLNSNYDFTYKEYLSISNKIKEANELFVKVNTNSFNYDEINSEKILQSDNYKAVYTEIQHQYQQALDLQNKITKNLIEFSSNYNSLNNWKSKIITFLSYISSKYKKIKAEKESTIIDYNKLEVDCTEKNYFTYTFASVNNIEKFEDLFPTLKIIQAITQQIIAQEEHFENFFNYKKFLFLQDSKTQNLINALTKTKNEDWISTFTTYYLNQVILKTALENGIKDDAQLLFTELQETDNLLKQKLSEKINYIWQESMQNTIKTKDLAEIKYLYNQRKNKQFSSKNSLRKIIHQDFEFFTSLFPVLMVNPTVCTSILPMQENLFDFIILDEASQLRIEDTYSSLLRGKTKVISGDKHQMPPSNFFGNDVIFWNENEEENNVDDFLAESKSLLEYADDANFKSSYLDYHYRSLHPDLIQFSNFAFYQSRLIPLPEIKNYQALLYTNVEGVYKDGTNKKEADEIVDYIFKIEKINEEYPSIGIATFNIFQRNLIFDKLYEVAYGNPQKNEILQALLNKGLFVKNLENIQGDERDIMILSTTFGKDEEGKFRQFFGPLTQAKGYQLLNVIITRAKYALHVFTSVPETIFMQFETELLEKGNTGKSIFYAYLAYVKACSQNNYTKIEFIKTTLQKNDTQTSSTRKIKLNSVLKQQVFSVLEKKFGENIKLDYPLGGFNLDIVLLKNNQPFVSIHFENTSNYHAEVAYRIKIHLQKITTKYNIKDYPIWSYNWWKNAELEIENIINLYNS